MNLKDAFRFQNKIKDIMSEAESILFNDSNITKVETTYLRKKVIPEAENETIVEEPDTIYADKITEMAGFLVWMMSEYEKLSRYIRIAKDALPIDMDAEISLNRRRQHIASIFRNMVEMRNSEKFGRNDGIGYRFNAEGNQVTYRCDSKTVTTINFDRGVLRKYLTQLTQQSDDMSVKLDQCLVNSTVEYEPAFDVNNSFSEIFEDYLETL